MTERQRKILADAFVLLGGGVRRGKELARTGTIGQVNAHVKEMRGMLDEMEKALDLAAGAGNVLDLAERRKQARPTHKGSA